MWLALLNLLRINWKPLVFVIAVLCFGAFCYHKGAQSVRAEWDKKIAEETLKAREVEYSNGILSNELGIDHEKKLSTIDIIYADAIASVRTKTSGGMRPPSTATCESDGKASDDRVYKASKRIGIGREAERNTLKLVDLQTWVKEFCK